MTIQVKCPQCSKEYRLKDELAGKKIRCKECETSFAVPARKKKAQEEEPVDPDGHIDLAGLDLAEEERKSRAYKKRQIEDTQKKVKKTTDRIDHEHEDVIIGNLGKFAGIVLGVHFVSFGILWFLVWMQSDSYLKFFYYVWRVSTGLAGVICVGSMLGSIIWFLVLSFKEHPKFFGLNLVSGLLSWGPVTVLTAVGTRYLVRSLTGVEDIEDQFLDSLKPHLLVLGVVGGIGLAFPIYYISTRWDRVSRSIYLAFIGIGMNVAFIGTWSLIIYMKMMGDG
ncbi:MAG: hypothetical protein O2955_06745 [Planctomycetota bacterium]|nr:hypothetical protein [Planctomycetota bacterium]MDA1212193.1 hypothetical protein [Planctomycetota bacterium]